MNSSQATPRIITFYSYKGGTGRSMALANVAWILASNGKRVLVIDWDLEAPGLHRYFHPFLQDKELTSSDGVIDFVVDFAAEAITIPKNAANDWYLQHANILRYAFSLTWGFPSKGTLDLVPAGRQGPDYATRVNSFNWQKFYDELGGGIFLEAAKQSMSGYDYVLIDSRTGVSDTSGICTIQMPDILVACFTFNIQSIEGAAAVAESAHLQRLREDGSPGLRIFPVPMRVEMAEKQRLDLARDAARERFDTFLWHLPKEKLDQYWGRIEVPYQPFYAYEEMLATFGDKPLQTQSLLSSMEAVTDYISQGDVKQFPALPEEQRQEVLLRYARQPRPIKQAAATAENNRYWFYFSYARANNSTYLKTFFDDLCNAVRDYAGLPKEAQVGFLDELNIEQGDEWEERVRQALTTSRTMVCVCSPAYINSEFCGKEFQVFRQRVELYQKLSPQTGRPNAILPVVWIPATPLPDALNEIQFTDDKFPTSYTEEGLMYMMRLRARFQDDYEELLTRFARSIVNAAKENQLPVPEDLPPLSEVQNAFTEKAQRIKTTSTGPRSIEFVFAAAPPQEMLNFRKSLGYYGEGGGLDWRPFLPDSLDPVGLIAQEVANREHLFFSVVPFDENLPRHLREAEMRRSIVIIVLDPWSLNVDRYARILSEIDTLNFNFLSCAIMILWNEKDEETMNYSEVLLRKVAYTLPRRITLQHDIHFQDHIQSLEQFRQVLRTVINSIRMTIINQAEPAKRIDDVTVSRPVINRPDFT